MKTPSSQHRAPSAGRTLLRSALFAAIVTLPLWYFFKPSSTGNTALPKNPPAAGTLISEKCEDQGVGRRCFRLYVPQDHQDASSPTISIAALEIMPLGKGKSDQPPLVYLEGGPGYAGISQGDELYGPDGYFRQLYQPVLETGRSVLVIDTRGLGSAEPALRCPLAERAAWDELKRPSAERDSAIILAKYQDCFRGFQDASIDLAQYNSDAVARDVKMLREAMGYRQWPIYGVSYGARTALSVLDVDRAGVSAAVFDSPSYARDDVYAADQAAFDRVLGLIHKKRCSEGAPDCVEKRLRRLEALLERLEEDPIIIRKNPFSKPILIDHRDAMYLLHDALYGENGFELFLAMIDMMEGKKRGYFASLSNENMDWWDSLYWGYLDTAFSVPVSYATTCHEMYISGRLKDARFPVYTPLEVDYQKALCAIVDGPPYRGPLSARKFQNVPAFVLSGERDVITPPAYGEALARDIGGAWLLHDGAAHGVAFWSDDCVTKTLLDFLAGVQLTATKFNSCRAAITVFDDAV